MRTAKALCKLECGFVASGREIWLVTMSEGKLGILVKDEQGTPVIPIDRDFPGLSRVNIVSVILGTMGLLAAVPQCDPAVLLARFEMALVMTVAGSEEEQREMLSHVCDKESAQALIQTVWPAATKLSSQVFTEMHLQQIEHLCTLLYFDTSGPVQ